MQSSDYGPGVVVAEPDRLILRPSSVLLRRRPLIQISIVVAVLSLVFALALAFAFRGHVRIVDAIVFGLICAAFAIHQLAVQQTLIAVRSADGIYGEVRNRILRTRRRRLMHRYADVTHVRVRSRVNPNAASPGASPAGAWLHYDVLLEKGGRPHLLWYTRYPEQARRIATTVASFCNAAVDDETMR